MRTRIMALGGLFLLCAAALATQQSPGEKLYRDCRDKDVLDGDKKGAIPLCEQVIRNYPSDLSLVAKARLELAGLYDETGDPVKAREVYEALCGMSGQQQAQYGCDGLKGIPDPNGPIKIVTPFTDDPFSFAISPDGTKLVFQATVDGKSQLWLQSVPSGKAAPISGTENAKRALPFFSEDGKSIGFFAEQKLKRIGIEGGVAKELADTPSPQGGAWIGNDIVFNGQGLGGTIVRIPAAEGGRGVTVANQGAVPNSPRSLGDGRHFLYFAQRGGGGAVAVGSLEPGAQAPRLPANAASAQAGLFAPPDQLLYVVNGALFAQRVGPITLGPIGSATFAIDRVGRDAARPGLVAVSASANGPLAYRADVAVDKQMIWFDRNGRQGEKLGAPDRGSPAYIRLSPDGRYVVFHRGAGSGFGSLWVIATNGTPARQLRSDANHPVFSPNGEHIAMEKLRGTGNLYEETISILAGEGRWLRPGTGEAPTDWSRKEYILYERFGAATDLLALPVQGGDPIPVAATPARERNGRFSPDGNWVAYQSDELGAQDEVYVQPFPGSASRTKVSMEGGATPQWGRGGRELYFLSPDFHVMVVSVTLPANGVGKPQFGPPTPLFQLRQGSEFEAAADGERFLVLTPLEDAPPIYFLPRLPIGKQPTDPTVPAFAPPAAPAGNRGQAAGRGRGIN